MNPKNPEAGVTLIELLIALAIGSLLILGLVQVFAASRTAYQLSTGLARSQENGRFALDLLQRDVRMAGHAGCVNDQARFLPENITPSRPALVSTFLTAANQAAGNYAQPGLHPALRFDKSIEAYEAVDTATGDTLVFPATFTRALTSGEWSPAMPAQLFSDLHDPIPGSDILILRNFSPTGAQVTTFTAGDPATIAREAGFTPRVLIPADDGYPSYGGLVLAPNAFARDNARALRDFIAASVEGWRDYVHGDGTRADALIRRANPELNQRLLNAVRDSLRTEALVDGGDAALYGLGAMTPDRWQAFAEQTEAAYASPPDWREAFTAQYLPGRG